MTKTDLVGAMATKAGVPSAVVSVSVTAPGQVVLKGLVEREATKAKSEEVVKAVRGVNAVENKVLVSPSGGYA